MNKFTNSLNFNNSANLNAYEIQEARKKMRTLSNEIGMSSLNQNQNMTSFQNIPNLSSSTPIVSGEIRKVRQKMNEPVPQYTQLF